MLKSKCPINMVVLVSRAFGRGLGHEGGPSRMSPREPAGDPAREDTKALAMNQEEGPT